jgi:two-component system, OmpR family, response regulator
MNSNRIAVVIEDDPEIRELIATVLRQSGFHVETAADGVSGVEAVRLHRPGVITLDLALPDFDGLETVRRIRQVSCASIIMITASADESDTVLALAEGADDYLTKPFRPRELRARVAALLRRSRPPAVLEEGTAETVPADPAGQTGAPGAERGQVLPRGSGGRAAGGADAHGVQAAVLPARERVRCHGQGGPGAQAARRRLGRSR